MGSEMCIRDRSYISIFKFKSNKFFPLAVTELVEGDSSRKIVEIICRTSWLKSENQCGRIESFEGSQHAKDSCKI